MTVKELLELCPMDDVLAALADIENVEDGYRETFCRKYRNVIEGLKARTPYCGESFVLLGHRYRFDGKDSPDVSLFKKRAIAKEFEPVVDIDGMEDINKLSDKDMERLINLRTVPDSYAIDFISWDEILAFEVDEGNVETVGAATLLGALIEEMTFFGLRESDMRAERDDLTRCAAELDEILKLPPEEQRKHLKSADELFSELGVVDNRTEEEKDVEQRAWLRDEMFNKMERYQAVKRYWKGSAK